MSIALIGHAEGHAQSGASAILDTSTADFLGVVLVSYLTNPAILTDTKSNTWNALTLRQASAVRVVLNWVVPGSKKGVGHVFNTGAGNTYAFIGVLAFSGVDQTAPLNAGSDVGSAGTSPLQTGSITVNDGDLVISGVGAEGATGGGQVTGGLIIQDQADYGPAVNFGGASASLIKSGTGAINPTWSGVTTQATIACAIASFKAAATAGGSMVPLAMHSYRQRRTAV